MRFFRRLLFGPFTVIRWALFLFTPWMLFAGLLVYRYFQVLPDDREEAYVPFVYSVGLLYKALILQFPLIGLGFYLKMIFRRAIRTARLVHFLCAMALTLAMLAGTVFFMYMAYSYFQEQVS